MAMQRRPTTVQAEIYPEEYIIEEDLSEMGDTNPHTKLMEYTEGILKQRFRTQGYLVTRNVNIYHKKIFNSLQYIVPDNALIEVRLPEEEEAALSSWDAEKQAPGLVFEVASEGTWSHDIQAGPNDKPVIYGRIGVKEYFAYDPNTPQVWTRRPVGLLSRLRGWRYNALGQPIEIKPDDLKRLWSEVLQCYQSENRRYIRFTDVKGEVLLTDREADLNQEEKRRKQAEQRLQQEIVVRQQETLARQEAERLRKQAELDKQQAEQRLQQEVQARLELERRLAEFMKQQNENQ